MAAERLIMIRPANFGHNAETAASNIFQSNTNLADKDVNALAQKEFDGLLKKLTEHNVDVKVFEDTGNPAKPDAVFLNNWFSTHADGKVFLYPMLSYLRRAERRMDIIEYLQNSFHVSEVIDLSHFENEALYLEGTGSMVLNPQKKLLFANLSARTNGCLTNMVAEKLGYKPVLFTASKQGNEIYHTNVLMADGGDLVLANTDLVSKGERSALNKVLTNCYTDVVYLTGEQIDNYAGNALMVKNNKGDLVLAMSERAFVALEKAQIKTIEKHCSIVIAAIPTIENVGGGSVRCMLAENYLQPK
jgi:hypothetical protein